MPSKEFDRTLSGMVTTGLNAVKRAVSVRVRVECKECGGYKTYFDSSPCPHPGTHDGQQFDHDIRIKLAEAPKKEPEPLSIPFKTVPKELYKSKEERIEEVMREVAPFVPRKDGGYARTAAARAPTQETDPFKTKLDRHCAALAYENNNTEQAEDEDYIDPLPKYFLERRD